MRLQTSYTYGTSGKECYGTYNSTSQKGWGPAYENNCIHSGTIAFLGDLPASWYNYALATAGTINSENTSSSNPANNTTEATESICPKGWVLPTKVLIDSIGGERPGSSTYISSFSPVLGGRYYSGTLNDEAVRGYWWSSTAQNGARRYYLVYNSSDLYTSYDYRRTGNSIRCVQAP